MIIDGPLSEHLRPTIKAFHTIPPSGKPRDLKGIGRGGGVEYGNNRILAIIKEPGKTVSDLRSHGPGLRYMVGYRGVLKVSWVSVLPA
jgi:hypothetical protein